MLNHLKILFWKQRVNFRADRMFLIAVTVLPAVLLVLASTNSGSITKTAKSNEFIECKIDNFLYCNYPLTISVDPSIQDEYYSDTDSIKSTFDEAMSNVAMELGSDLDTIFKTDHYIENETTKDGGNVDIDSFESASVYWYNGENNIFAQNFVNLANQELEKVGNTIRFQEVDNPYQYEASGGFDLRVGTFLLLLRAVGNEITRERSSNMYDYMTRLGLLQSTFWIFQYVWWMLVASISIGITAIVALLLEMDIDTGAYFVSAWWHVALAAFLGTIFKEKKYFDLATIAILIVGFALPITFSLALESENIVDGVYCIPLFFVMNDAVSSFQILVGSIISFALMLLSAYLVPILCVSDGYYADGKINLFYFLSSGFWKEGIVAVPRHDRSSDQTDSERNSTLSLKKCVKRFAPVKKCFKKEHGEEKVIGPMNLDMEVGKITTLLGHNGVGKSTLLKIAAGYYIPSEGEMLLGDINIFRERPWSCLKSISFCPQDNLLYENMTVEEHLILITSIRDMSAVGNIKDHIDWILSTLDIESKKATIAKNLSGGMKRRLCLAMAVAGFPRFILCDEPSSGVDSITQRGIWKLLETAKTTSAIVLTTHDPLEAVILSNSVVWMESSEEISHTNGVQKMAFSVKNQVENSTTEYEISTKNANQVANVIASLPRSKMDWKIASKRLNSGQLPPIEDLLEHHDEDDNFLTDQGSSLTAANGVPEGLGCYPPSFWRQVIIMMSTTLMHPDRLFFLVFFGLPINGALIYVATIYNNFDDIGKLIITPLVPMIGIISSSIITIQLTEMFARDRSLGITKLLMSQGITLPAYLFAYISLYFFLSFPGSVGFMLAIGLSSNGTSTGIFALFMLYLSFFVMMLSICCVLGALLDANIATTITFIAPSLFGICGQGSTSQTFANMYPGSLSQVMAGLLINHVSDKEWRLYALTIVINLLIGGFCSYVFVLRMRNSSSSLLSSCARSGKASENLDTNDSDIENELMPKNDTLLEGRQIIKSYALGETKNNSFRALDNVTFSIKEGSLLGLVGKSGAGKSTLMDILSGQLDVSSGSVFVEGKKTEPTEISKVVSMCGQVDTVWPTVTVINAIKIFLKCRGHRVSLFSKLSDPYILYLIERLGLEETLNKKVKSLSGGQKRKLAFLFSLFGKTKVVLVDEAMTGVDIETRQIMWKVLQDEIAFRGRSVVVTSHDMGEVEQYCNTIGILHDGKLVEMGRLDDIKKKWGDSVKLVCLIDELSSVSIIETTIKKKLKGIIMETPVLDILNEINESRTVVTFEMNLMNLQNIAALIQVMNVDPSIKEKVFYWSIEPQVLDDFVRAKSRNDPKLD